MKVCEAQAVVGYADCSHLKIFKENVLYTNKLNHIHVRPSEQRPFLPSTGHGASGLLQPVLPVCPCVRPSVRTHRPRRPSEQGKENGCCWELSAARGLWRLELQRIL